MMDVKYSWGTRVDQRDESVFSLTLTLSGSWFIFFGPCFSQYHHSSFYLMLNSQYYMLPLSFSLRLIVTSFAGIWVLFCYPVWSSVLLSPTSHSPFIYCPRFPVFQNFPSVPVSSYPTFIITSGRLFLTSTNLFVKYLSQLEYYSYICMIIFSKCLDWFCSA